MNLLAANRLPTRGFTLVEVTLALGIAVFCLVVVFGLLGVGMNTSSSSVEQTNASNILCAVAADLRAAPTPTLTGTAGAASTTYKLTLPTNSQAATGPVTQVLDASGQPTANQGRYQLDVWATPGVGRGATQVRVMVSWPPKAAVPAGTVESVIALDRN